MKWRKLGRIFCADNHSDWMYTHAMLPIPEQIDGDLYRIYFSPRDKLNRGHVASLELDMREPLRVLHVHDRPLFEPGELGCFDDSGVLTNTIVHVNGRKWLYYVGFNLGVTVTFRNSIGLAEWNEETHRFERLFKGPVIDRTKEMPHFVASPEVMFDGTRFRAWFAAGTRWERRPEGARHYYHLEYAESANGMDWKRDGTVAIDFRDEHEYAIAGPRVLREGDLWRMWFCSRATADVADYRIQYAESSDGIHWVRKDNEAGIDVSEEGWDSEMVCYPFVFDHAGQRYMLYNGNKYGLTGFGIAVLD